MSKFRLEVIICDDDGTNCQPPVLMDSTEIPVSDGWFQLVPGTPEYWDVVTGFGALMGLVWAIRFTVRYVSGRK